MKLNALGECAESKLKAIGEKVYSDYLQADIRRSVRSLSVSFFIEKEPHSSQEWNEREKVKGGGRDTQLVRVNEATAA